MVGLHRPLLRFKLLIFLFLGCYGQWGENLYGSDTIYRSICTGVNLYDIERPLFHPIFSVCPTSNEINEFIEMGAESQSRVFQLTKLNPELKDSVELTKGTLGNGIKGFVEVLWRLNPIRVQMTPYDAIASGYRNAGLHANDVRNFLLYGRGERVKSYQRISFDESRYVTGRMQISEHFKVEWVINPNKWHLSPLFKQRLNQLTDNPAMIDSFIRDFGTHYRRSVTFGGAFGADFYFPGFGTSIDQESAVSHVNKCDLKETFDPYYQPDFGSFNELPVEVETWRIGGDVLNDNIGYDEWYTSITDFPELVRQDLWSLTELMEASGLPNIWPILDRFEDRVAVNGRHAMKFEAPCLFKNCPRGFVCMGQKCVPLPQEPQWPDYIPYCMPKPKNERCPSSDLSNEFTSDTWVYWDTENGPADINYKGADHITSHGLDSDKILAQIETDYNGGIKMFFCCHRQPTTSGKDRVKWPAGSYCLYAYKTFSIASPREWCFESIVWNDEDQDNQNDFSKSSVDEFSELPLGMYHKSYTEQKLLCRDDGDCNEPIVLPKSYPFYLVRNKHCCQEVLGMEWIHVEISWDTENDLNGENAEKNDTVRRNHWKRICRECTEPRSDVKKCTDYCEERNDQKPCPRVGPDKVTLDFCYYRVPDSPRPTPSPTLSPTLPTRAPTTGAPTPAPPTPTRPPTPPPPTKNPTPFPTRPTPTPTFPTKSPTRSPTREPPSPPTPAPTRAPTPAPTRPTPPPTPLPTPAPTPSPTICPYCDQMQTVNIIGLNSIWPNDVQPSDDVFVKVPCDCQYCVGCRVTEDCEVRYYIGDFMLLSKFWRDHPVKLEENDMVFPRITWFENGIDTNNFPDTNSLNNLKKGTQIDLAHARNALLFGGSERMQTYSKVFSIMDRYIYVNHDDRVWMTSHMVPRVRKREMVESVREGPPTLHELHPNFRVDALAAIRSQWQKKPDKSTKYEQFIRKYGTHYIVRAVWGGMYGIDFYYTGYGTKSEMIMGLRDVKNHDVPTTFEHYRLNEFDVKKPKSGRSFIRALGGRPEVGPDIKGWFLGGDPYGIRGSSGHANWEKELLRDTASSISSVIIHHKELASISNLIALLPKPGFVPSEDEWETLNGKAQLYFKDKVVELAYFWLVLHYRCFFMDTACENRRRHPFLREDVDGDGCKSNRITREFLRTRTEMETCVGQENKDSGYLLQSTIFGRNNEPAKWCQGLPDVRGVPKNNPPFVPARKMNCPLVPPTPRWPNFISFCLPKPVSSIVRECPKEQYPEYNWNWDWDDYAIDYHTSHGLYSKALQNENFDFCDNINPTNEIYSAYPWKYKWNDYEPRDESCAGSEVCDGQEMTRYKNFLLNYKANFVPFKCKFTDCECIFEHIDENGPHFPVNRYYIRSQAPFLQEIGWAFWDTEDDTDVGRDPKTVQYIIHGETPTHMPVAKQYQLKNGDWPWDPRIPPEQRVPWTDTQKKEGGRITRHVFVEDNPDAIWHLWETPELPSFHTGGVLMSYCCTTISEGQSVKAVHTLHWPDGHLCIYAHGAIDSTDYQFRQGSIGWDCENGENKLPKRFGNKIYEDPNNAAFNNWDDVAQQQRLTESLPAGLYHVQFDGQSDQYISQNLLCMKTNTAPERDIELPRDVPFYMMMHAGSCQLVRGTFVTAVSLTWYTEKDHITRFTGTAGNAHPNGPWDTMFIELEMNSWGRATAYGRIDQLPDGWYSQQKIEIKYCFYQPNARLEKFTDGSGRITFWEQDCVNDVLTANNVQDGKLHPSQDPKLNPYIREVRWNNDIGQPEEIGCAKRSATTTLDIRAMDGRGRYTVPWPLDESKSLCGAPTRAPIIPPPTPPTPPPTLAPTTLAPTTPPPTPSPPTTQSPTRRIPPPPTQDTSGADSGDDSDGGD